MNKTFKLLLFGLFLCLSFALLAEGYDEPGRSKRVGIFKEGTPGQLVSGNIIDVLSVRISHQEIIPFLPETFRARFFLPEPVPVYLTIRELDPEYHYKADATFEPPPTNNWKPNFHNELAWSTKPVIQGLEGLRLDQLGGIARLGYQGARKEETVAPIILYASQLPKRITNYVFTLKTNQDATLFWTIGPKHSAPRKGDLGFQQKVTGQAGGRPFNIIWDAAQAPDGWYTFTVTGWLVSNNEPITQHIHFYHKAEVN